MTTALSVAADNAVTVCGFLSQEVLFPVQSLHNVTGGSTANTRTNSRRGLLDTDCCYLFYNCPTITKVICWVGDSFVCIRGSYLQPTPLQNKRIASSTTFWSSVQMNRRQSAGLQCPHHSYYDCTHSPLQAC